MEAAEEGISGPGDIAFPGHKPLELRSSTPGSVSSAFLEMTQSFPFPPTDSDARPAGRSRWSEVMLEEAADCLLRVSFPENVVKAVSPPPPRQTAKHGHAALRREVTLLPWELVAGVCAT